MNRMRRDKSPPPPSVSIEPLMATEHTRPNYDSYDVSDNICPPQQRSNMHSGQMSPLEVPHQYLNQPEYSPHSPQPAMYRGDWRMHPSSNTSSTSGHLPPHPSHAHPPPPPTHTSSHRDHARADHYQPPPPPQHPLHHSANSTPPYRILCITNINHKISDNAVKEALTRDFSRFGDISVSVCHDNGERLAYIYFRYYEEAREARHAKSRTVLFDKLIEIEPIFERRSPPVNSPPASYMRTRSPTPPEYYGSGPHPAHHPMNHPRAGRPVSSYHKPISPSLGAYRSQTPPYGYAYDLTNVYPQAPPNPHMSNTEGMVPGYGYHKPYYPYQNTQYPPNPYPHAYSRDSEYYRGGLRDQYAHHIDYRHEPSSSHHSSSPKNSLPHLNYNYHQSKPELGENPNNHRYSPPSSGYMSYNSPGSSSRDRDRRSRSGRAEEERPTKAIVVNYLDPICSDAQIRETFEAFGVMEEIEIRRPTGAGLYANAFIRYSTVEMAKKAKYMMVDQHIGKYPCKITYGTNRPNKRLWVGGIGPWVDSRQLEEEFEKFGKLVAMDYSRRQYFAFVEYENIENARNAYNYMRGFVFGDKRIRVEYADPDPNLEKAGKTKSGSVIRKTSPILANDTGAISNSSKRSLSPTNSEPSKKKYNNSSEHSNENDHLSNNEDNTTDKQISVEVDSNSKSDNKNYEVCNDGSNGSNISRCKSKSRSNSRSRSSSTSIKSPQVQATSGSCLSISEIIQTCSYSWKSLLILKNGGFSSKLYLINGAQSLIESYIVKNSNKDTSPLSQLKITQRLPLHQRKLEDVERKVEAEKCCMFIILEDQSPSTNNNNNINNINNNNDLGTKNNNEKDDNQTDDKPQQDTNNSTGAEQCKVEELGETTINRPLRNLVCYLKKKDAAGIVSLVSKNANELPKLLYIFPPCSFSDGLLRRTEPNLETPKEEYLLGVVVRGG